MINSIKPIKLRIPKQINGDNLVRAKQKTIESIYPGQLKASGQTLLGLCPFHDDHHPSFAVYTATNTWTCFAGCGSGDSIDFYMRLNRMDFRDTIRAMS